MTGSQSAPTAAVVGWPAAHSLSPLMMSHWLTASGLSGRYCIAEIPPDRFPRALAAIAELDLAGVNITVPHKEAALRQADEATEAARSIGAANLITVSSSGRLKADNTDIIGVAAALRADTGLGPAVLLGAGGAARAALYHLKGQDRPIRIVNRTRARAESLAGEFEIDAQIYTAPDGDALNGATLVINATSLGMAGQPRLDPDLSSLDKNALVFDMVYAPLETELLASARASGRRVSDGLEMLIGQARPSFEAFFGTPPPAGADVRSVLEAELERRE